MIDDARLHDLLGDIEEQRCRAMIDIDRSLLARMLHEDLVWIHASGRIDSKAALIAMLERDRPYRDLSISNRSTRRIGDACISTGAIAIALASPDAPPPYSNLFTNIWRIDGPQPVLVHGQSTRCPPSTR